MTKRKPVVIDTKPLRVTIHNPKPNKALVVADILNFLANALIVIGLMIAAYGYFGGAA